MSDSVSDGAHLKRLRLRSWRRGTREMDLLLGPFADVRLATMSAAELDGYEALLAENDHDLYAWATGRVTPPDRHSRLMALVMAHASAALAQRIDAL